MMEDIKYRVDYFESERGWGSDEWSSDYLTEELALAAVDECNKGNPTDHIPDYYIVATYKGPVVVRTPAK